ncbi:hypothetical protein ACMYSQ_001625 [Aspergillus niger]
MAAKSQLPTVNTPVSAEPSKAAMHPAFYIATWIALSSGVIIFNKWILHTAGFSFRTSIPIFTPRKSVAND